LGTTPLDRSGVVVVLQRTGDETLGRAQDIQRFWSISAARHLASTQNAPASLAGRMRPMSAKRWPSRVGDLDADNLRLRGKRTGNADGPSLAASRPQCHRTAHFLPDRSALASRNGVNG
jgi:hypothetical protein